MRNLKPIGIHWKRELIKKMMDSADVQPLVILKTAASGPTETHPVKYISINGIFRT